jgi:hypothetical protein
MSPGDGFWSACGATGVKHTEWLSTDFAKGSGVSKGCRRCCVEEIIQSGKTQYLHRANLEELVYQSRTTAFVGINPDIATCLFKDGDGTFHIVLWGQR